MDKLFKLKENGTDVRTEVLAGLTTFFAMSYILFVNPQMLSLNWNASSRGIPCYDYWFCCRNFNDGFLCKLAICTGSRYGT